MCEVDLCLALATKIEHGNYKNVVLIVLMPLCECEPINLIYWMDNFLMNAFM